MSLAARLRAYKQEEQDLYWEGTFEQYLGLVEKNPNIANTAHARVYDMIVSAGVEEVDGHKIYHFFDDELFGLQIPLERLVEEYFHSAARRLDVRKRILLLMGPVSGGKSSLVTLLKRGLEAYSRTDRGAAYGIKGCPMHEEPLHLIPHRLRPEMERELNVHIEGDLCPVCQLRLEEEFGGDILRVPVERILFSETKRIGIGTFSPSDPKSQDIADLTGSVDFSTIAEYGSESDPRAFRFDGELNKANRGILEMQEMLKIDSKFLYHLLSLTQEGNFKAGRFALISADELVIAHTNETEYQAFISNKKNEALHSRMVVMPIPYTLRVSDEVRIYEKLIQQSDLRDVHIAPHGLRTAAIFSVLSRLKESAKADLMKKLKLYDGQDVEKGEIDVKELQAEHPLEGMSGIDPRYVINRISSALVKSDARCINALDILRSLKDGLDQHASITSADKERLLNFIAMARQEYDEVVKKEVQKAFVYSYEESAQTLFNNYLDNVEAYCNRQKLRDPITDEEVDPDETLMRSVEEQIGVSENAKTEFREEILIRMSSYARRGKVFRYDSHERLKEAIERKLFADLKDVVKITTNTKTPDPDQLKRINQVHSTLVDKHGYCPVCANEVLKYVGSLLNR
ncbi:PrkA family serine protein kinase [Alicyclobacillus macrosporangiidus]|uniref:Serine protein kinase n=1 Tax=Alicyclobacillus macrosporangiidus TaxID=392015 RepID=A0A1I7KGU1_9BACL|nr:PrkA family serine protein kinase [Alicyclobacillus macrosporangiidus]SFU96640.1 serine protein kinase [Alicyclobacillus macrosporangiidus]